MVRGIGDAPARSRPLLEVTLRVVLHLAAAAVVLAAFSAFVVWTEPLLPEAPAGIYEVAIHNLHWILLVEYFLVTFVLLQQHLLDSLLEPP